MSESETRNARARIHPTLLPFVDQCLASDKLNCQGGVLEVMKPRARWAPLLTLYHDPCSHRYYSTGYYVVYRGSEPVMKRVPIVKH